MSERMLYQQPIKLVPEGIDPLTGFGRHRITVPFSATYIAVVNGTKANLCYTTHDTMSMPSDCIPVQSYGVISAPVKSTQVLNLFYMSPPNEGESSVVVMFSDYPIEFYGSVMNPNGTVQSVVIQSGSVILGEGTKHIGSVTVEGVAQPVILGPSAAHIGSVDVLTLPVTHVILDTELPTGTKKIGSVDIASEIPAGTKKIGSVDIASEIPAGTKKIGSVDIASEIPAGTKKIGSVDIASEIPAGTKKIGSVDIASLPSVNRSASNYAYVTGIVAGLTIKPTAGILQRVVINSKAAAAGTATIKEGTNTVAIIDLMGVSGPLEYGLGFDGALTIETTVSADITIMFN